MRGCAGVNGRENLEREFHERTRNPRKGNAYPLIRSDALYRTIRCLHFRPQPIEIFFAHSRVGMVSPKTRIKNLIRAGKIAARVRHIAQLLEQHAEIVEPNGDAGMVGTKLFFVNGEGALEMGLCAV